MTLFGVGGLPIGLLPVMALNGLLLAVMIS